MLLRDGSVRNDDIVYLNYNNNESCVGITLFKGLPLRFRLARLIRAVRSSGNSDKWLSLRFNSLKFVKFFKI